MAGRLELLEVEPPEVASEAEGQTKSSKKTEDLLEMVKKLQKEGSLEPQIEDLINRINELQQAKKKSSEELGEAQALWEALHRELDSLNEEKVHLEEILSKKQEALRTLQLHCQRTERESQRKYVLSECAEQISIHNSQITESQKQEAGVACGRTAGGFDRPAQGPLGIPYAEAATGLGDQRPAG
uniref:Synaptonemal complex central element protein 1-like isoform X3 n=1 Tax=Camelus bactrianus TaxID=9837 RepID=A0A9W3FII5_CAMBA|nr:synaptonemal complex central element protein 1-like isoform X3 [Camelus bactrianus]